MSVPKDQLRFTVAQGGPFRKKTLFFPKRFPKSLEKPLDLTAFRCYYTSRQQIYEAEYPLSPVRKGRCGSFEKGQGPDQVDSYAIHFFCGHQREVQLSATNF